MRPEELAKTLDHTVLGPRATRDEVERACADARDHHFATVCSFPVFLPLMVERLRSSDVKVCTVISFPFGADLPESKVAAAERAVEHGAHEIDVVMSLPMMLSGEFKGVRDELTRIVRAARSRAANTGRGNVLVKAIIEAPHLDDKLKRLACKIVADAGADFAKTATGVGTAATAYDVELMRDALPESVAVKAAGGIRTVDDVESMINAGASRVGTSASVQIMRDLTGVGGAA